MIIARRIATSAFLCINRTELECIRVSMAENPKNGKAINALWGGRYGEGPSAIMTAINASIGFDHKLAAYDVEGSLAHARMLGQQGILSKEDVVAIEKGLTAIADEIRTGKFVFDAKLED